jgi:L-threonylcarbamoyladenylate synthase
MDIQKITHKLLENGVIAVIPTDTVYGVVARAKDQQAVARLYELKHRENKPGTVIAASIEQLVSLGIKQRYLRAVQQFWPGPVSIIIPCGQELYYLHQGKFGLAIRIPNDDTVRKILLQTGPLLTSSANQPGEPPATTIQAAKDYFHDGVDLYIDGGDLSNRVSSTVIQVIDDSIEVLREGAMSMQAIKEKTNDVR